MTKIEGREMSRQSLFMEDNTRLDRRVSASNINEIASQMETLYAHETLKVKNILNVLRETCKVFDHKFPNTEKKERKEIVNRILNQLIERGEETSYTPFAHRALRLLVEYPIDLIAEESLSSLEKDDQEGFFGKFFQDELISRTRIPYTVNLESSSLKELVQEEEVKFTEIPDTIEIPSKATSMALAKAAADNQEAIRVQVEEATHYIRMTKIEVDEKVAGVQQALIDKIERALIRVDEITDTVKTLLEGAQELSNEIKGELEGLINKIAEKLIEAIQTSKACPQETELMQQGEATVTVMEELDEKVEELESVSFLSLPPSGSRILMNGLIANRSI